MRISDWSSDVCSSDLRIIAFGSHDGRLPGALSPSPDYAGGPLRLVPWSLAGDTDIARAVGAQCERDLMERGMAGADTALLAQEAVGGSEEHTSEIQSLMRILYAVFCLKKKNTSCTTTTPSAHIYK